MPNKPDTDQRRLMFTLCADDFHDLHQLAYETRVSVALLGRIAINRLLLRPHGAEGFIISRLGYSWLRQPDQSESFNPRTILAWHNVRYGSQFQKSGS